MSLGSFALDPDALNVAFPFHFVVSAEGRLMQVGSSLMHLLGAELPTAFEDWMRIRRPSSRAIQDCVGHLVLVDVLQAEGVLLRGQFVRLGGGAMAFVGAPFVSDLEQLTANGLRLKHFALHDPVVDYLTLFQTLTASLNDSRALRESLERANGELKEAIDSALAAQGVAEAASRAKSDFLANMSHELRTPIASILGFAEIACSAQSEESERNDALNRIRDNSAQMVSFVDDLLHFAELGSSNVSGRSEEFVLRDLVLDAMDSARQRHASPGVKCEILQSPGTPARLESDQRAIARVLGSLIGNAFKFTDSGCVTVSLDWSDDVLEFVVSDTGVGIPEGAQSEIFGAFTQADGSRTRKHGGAGLGLALARRLAQGIGGDLRLLASTSSGSRFSFSVPAARVEPEPGSLEDSKSLRANGANRPTRILVVEDSADLRRLLKVKLRSLPLELTFANDGVEALAAYSAAAEGRGVDLVLMDMQMPRMDGYTATRTLRERGADLPIVAMTAHSMNGERQRCLDAGADAFVPKPIDWQYLTGLIDQLVD